MNVSSRLAIANLARSAQRAEREDIAADSPQASVIRGKLVGSGRDGYTLQTQSGGTITIPRRTTDPQNFSPTKGAVYQASISAGIARIQASSRSKATEAQRQVVKQFIVAAGPPTIDDKGTPDTPFWVDIGTKDPAGGLFQSDLYIWSGALDGYAKVSGDGAIINFVAGPPTTPAPSGTVNGQWHYNTTDNTLSVYDEAADVWRTVGGGGGAPINYVAGPPTTPAPSGTVDGQGHHDTVVDRLWTYDLANTTWRASGSKNFFQGVPSSDPNSFIRGDRVTTYEVVGGVTSPCDYIWSETQSDWLLVSCCPNCPDEFFNSQCDDDEGFNGNLCSPLPP